MSSCRRFQASIVSTGRADRPAAVGSGRMCSSRSLSESGAVLPLLSPSPPSLKQRRRRDETRRDAAYRQAARRTPRRGKTHTRRDAQVNVLDSLRSTSRSALVVMRVLGARRPRPRPSGTGRQVDSVMYSQCNSCGYGVAKWRI
ncbi:hypothetical protein IF2G_06287 [Cordyceps javanica]|nr:hypothetical protein IF2G_06287 [Cordyceps javanica]